MGRLDSQVKIRGVRIELGEIESCLKQQPEIKEAVVVVREDREKRSEKELVAYIVEASATDLSMLRNSLRQTLPDVMIPAFFVSMEAIPLTPNGKINRRVLPAPDLTESSQRTVYVAPRTETEAKLAAIWQEVMQMETVGVEDNFFDVGGHSLSAMQIAARIRKTFQIELALRPLLAHPTVADLARYLDDLTLGQRLQTQKEDHEEDALELVF